MGMVWLERRLQPGAGEGLAGGEAAIVGGKLFGNQHVVALGGECGRGTFEQAGVLETSAAEHHRGNRDAFAPPPPRWPPAFGESARRFPGRARPHAPPARRPRPAARYRLPMRESPATRGSSSCQPAHSPVRPTSASVASRSRAQGERIGRGRPLVRGGGGFQQHGRLALVAGHGRDRRGRPRHQTSGRRCWCGACRRRRRRVFPSVRRTDRGGGRRRRPLPGRGFPRARQRRCGAVRARPVRRRAGRSGAGSRRGGRRCRWLTETRRPRRCRRGRSRCHPRSRPAPGRRAGAVVRPARRTGARGGAALRAAAAAGGGRRPRRRNPGGDRRRPTADPAATSAASAAAVAAWRSRASTVS